MIYSGSIETDDIRDHAEKQLEIRFPLVNTKVDQRSKGSAFRADLTEGLNMIFKEALAMRCPCWKLKTLVNQRARAFW